MVVPGGVDRSGTERVIPALLNLIERVATRHDLHVIAFEQGPEYARYPLLGAVVTNLGRAPVGVWGANLAFRYRKLLKIIRDDGPFDVLHAIWANGPGTVAAMAGRRCGIPVIVSIGGGELANLPQAQYGGALNWRIRRQVGYALKHAAFVTGGSRFVLNQCSRNDAVRLPLGIDCSLFMPPCERPAGPPWRLLQVASINRVKDQFTALEAVRLLVDQGFDVSFDLVGEDTLRGALQRFAGELGIAARVRFLGFRSNADLADIYRQSHVYVQSSLYESQGVSILEAAVAGLPIVGTEVGLVAELAPAAAVSVPVADSRKLAAAIGFVLSNPGVRDRLSGNASRFARACDADWTARQFETLYVQVQARQQAKA